MRALACLGKPQNGCPRLDANFLAPNRAPPGSDGSLASGRQFAWRARPAVLAMRLAGITLPAMHFTATMSQARELAAFRRRLLRWYRGAARTLPWRTTRDAYRIWVSEVMLQQTTVAAVLPYFARFIRRFPTLRDLSRAPLDHVLRHWEGLGYYRRARALHAAARLVEDQHKGRIPRDPAELQKLPGIGRYTAGAIASFAFDRAAPIVEANTRRLYARLLGYAGNPCTTAGQRALWQFAAALLPRKGAGLVNQALMELGATVCLADKPGCQICPVARHCAALAMGRQHQIPRQATKPPAEVIAEVCVALHRNGKLLLVRRPEGGRWAGLWDFPRFALPAGQSPTARAVLALREQCGVAADDARHVGSIKHVVTRFRITLHCVTAQWRAGTPRGTAEHAWVDPGGLEPWPMPVSARRFAALLGAPRTRQDKLRSSRHRQVPG